MSFLSKSRKKEDAAEKLHHSSPNSSQRRSERNERSFKGFHTSITSIFKDQSSTRVDCCSISCCGIFQYDYNRYLLHNARPPTWKNRFIQHVCIPIVIFCLAGAAAVHISDPTINTILCTTLLFISIFWIIGGCLQSTYKRVSLRRAFLKKKRYGPPSDSEPSFDDMDLDQTNREMYCSHFVCGCYPTDFSKEESDDDLLENGSDKGDLCACLSRAFAAACCGKFCSLQLQFFGACALAQEGREINSIIPLERRRFDYITFQPFVAYFNQIRTLRLEKNGKLWDHYAALSKLSRILLKTLGSVIVLLLVVAGVFSPQRFQWGNMVVFLATLLQAFLVLYFVHWYWNRFDISLDAVIKYFACGFAITTTTAIFFELAESISLQILAKTIMKLLPLEVENDGYGAGFDVSFFDFSPHNMYTADSAGDYKRAFSKQYPWISVIFLFISAYCIAAMVEEMCKYFGFKMIDHPDFMSEHELQKAASHGIPQWDEDEDRFEMGGGMECGSGLEGINSEEYESYDTDDAPPQQSLQSAAKDQPPSSLACTSVQLSDAPPRTNESIASSITVAMVSVALGFACCENLIYIFVYNDSSLSMEVSVLITRSLFPVHPLCAAIQSIGVCKQQLENNKSIGLGRILLPAILLHGSYDFAIMLLNLLATLNTNDDDDDDASGAIIYSILSLGLMVTFVIAGIWYYVWQSYKQVQRLQQLNISRNFVGVRA